MNTYLPRILGAIVFAAPLFQGCASSPSFVEVAPSFGANEAPVPSPLPTPDPNDIHRDFPQPPGQETAKILKAFQPSLAIRGASCIMCHARIRGNMITDFGYGDPWFFGGANAALTSVGWHNDYAGTWQTIDELSGTVFVPDAQMPSNILTGAGFTEPMKVADFMMATYPVDQSFWLNTTGRTSMASNITPAANQPKVAAANILIRAPTEEEILSLAPILAQTDADFLQIMPATGTVTEATGLMRVQGNGSHFIQNDPQSTFVCSGADIVIKGPLYLKDARINADAGGCRLYVAGSVFIEGPITYVGTSSEQNLQISSSRAVSMGIDYGNLYNRLIPDNRGSKIRGAMSYLNFAQQILDDAAVIGSLKDASNITGMPIANTGISYWGTRRASVDYTAILLNAPILESRYLGKVQGSLISELALFSLGEFYFEFDPVFTASEIPIFPLFADHVSILSAQ